MTFTKQSISSTILSAFVRWAELVTWTSHAARAMSILRTDYRFLIKKLPLFEHIAEIIGFYSFGMLYAT